MIKVFIDSNRLNFGMVGHSEFGPVGSDIVCAAATMLASTLIESVTDKLEPSEVAECALNSGYAQLKVFPLRKKDKRACRTIYDAICKGFRLLAKRYPEHVSIDETGVLHRPDEML